MDFTRVVELQNRYLKANLSEDDRSGGFLSNAFSVEQFRSINKDCCVVIAVDDEDHVLGFLCGSTWEAMKGNALVAAMIASVDMSTINPAATCIAGPVCIDDAARGQGLMGKLYDILGLFLQKETAMHSMMVFINDINAASIRAHEKIGFKTIADFVHNGLKYATFVKEA